MSLGLFERLGIDPKRAEDPHDLGQQFFRRNFFIDPAAFESPSGTVHLGQIEILTGMGVDQNTYETEMRQVDESIHEEAWEKQRVRQKMVPIKQTKELYGFSNVVAENLYLKKSKWIKLTEKELREGFEVSHLTRICDVLVYKITIPSCKEFSQNSMRQPLEFKLLDDKNNSTKKRIMLPKAKPGWFIELITEELQSP